MSDKHMTINEWLATTPEGRQMYERMSPYMSKMMNEKRCDECAALRAENERLETLLHDSRVAEVSAWRGREEAVMERDQYRAESERLREAARAVLAEWDDDLGGAISISAAARLRDALGEEP